MKTNTLLKPYIKITTPDSRYFVWIRRPDHEGRSFMTFNFGMDTEFADRLDRLSYPTVESISRLDRELCTLMFSLKGDTKECISKMIEDIPDILDGLTFLINSQINTAHHD